MSLLHDLHTEIQDLRDEEKAQHLQRFFKTAEGEYGYGDVFAGKRILA